MTDNTDNIKGAIENDTVSADSLPRKAMKHSRDAVAGVLAGLAIAVSSPALAQTAPVSQSTSASAAADKGGSQMVQLQGGKKMNFLEISGLRGKQKEDIINKMTDEEYSGYDKYIENRKQAANQRIGDKKEVEQAVNQRIGDKKEVEQAVNQEEKKVDEALNQQEELKNLLNTLFDTQGVGAGDKARYQSQAPIVTAFLTNPITRPKDADTLAFLQNVKLALENGKNPFAHISKQGREKLMAMIK